MASASPLPRAKVEPSRSAFHPLTDSSVGHDVEIGKDAAARTAALMLAKQLVWERRQRASHFPQMQFGEPTWDILLDLYVARQECRVVDVTSLCIAAGVPITTALRWITKLTSDGVLARDKAPKDRRRRYISLTDQTASKMDDYLARVLKNGAAGER